MRSRRRAFVEQLESRLPLAAEAMLTDTPSLTDAGTMLMALDDGCVIPVSGSDSYDPELPPLDEPPDDPEPPAMMMTEECSGTVSISITETLNEAQNATATLSHTTPEGCTWVSYVISWGDSYIEDYTTTDPIEHTYSDDDPSGTSSDVFTVNVTAFWNPGNATATAQTTITVRNVAPTAVGDEVIAHADADKTFNVLTNDTDPSHSDVLTVTSINITGVQGHVTFEADGDIFYNPNGKFDYLTINQEATETFQYTITDDDGGTSTGTVTITVKGARELYDLTWSVEGGANEDGEVPAKLVLTLDPPAKTSVTVNWSMFNIGTLNGGSGEYEGTDRASPSDWHNWSGTETFEVGQHTKNVSLRPKDDEKVELNETNQVGIKAPDGSAATTAIVTDAYILNLPDPTLKDVGILDDEWRWVDPGESPDMIIEVVNQPVPGTTGKFSAWALAGFVGFNGVSAFDQATYKNWTTDEAIMRNNMSFSIDSQTGVIWRNDGIIGGGVAKDDTVQAAIGSSWDVVAPNDSTRRVPVTYSFIVGYDINIGGVEVSNKQYTLTVTQAGVLEYQAQVQLSLIAKRGADN